MELGPRYFAPGVLRAIVTYNEVLLSHVASQILDANDWGLPPEVLPNAEPRTRSVFACEAVGEIAEAVRRRLRDDTPAPVPADRIAWALDFDALADTERQALENTGLGKREDPLGTAILVGLLSRSLAILSMDLQDLDVSPDDVSDVWVEELCEIFQEEINGNLADDAYQVACALSELKNKFLLAPLADQLREERAARAPRRSRPRRPPPRNGPRTRRRSTRPRRSRRPAPGTSCEKPSNRMATRPRRGRPSRRSRAWGGLGSRGSPPSPCS